MLCGDIQITSNQGELIKIGEWTARRKKKLTKIDEQYTYDVTYKSRPNPILGHTEDYEYQGLVTHYYDDGMEMLIAKIMLAVWDDKTPVGADQDAEQAGSETPV